jgi:oligoribonuclease
MPRLEEYFNYRHIDVSSFKEAAVRWMNGAQVYTKNGSHRAMGDIKDSVGELLFYKDLFLPDQ